MNDIALEAQLLSAEPDHLVWQVDAGTTTQATVAVGWSPKWHGRLDGHDVRLRRTDPGLLGVDLPSGEHRLTLQFRADPWDWLGRVMTLLTIAALLAWPFRLRDWWQERRPSVEHSDGRVAASPSAGEAVEAAPTT